MTTLCSFRSIRSFALVPALALPTLVTGCETPTSVAPTDAAAPEDASASFVPDASTSMRDDAATAIERDAGSATAPDAASRPMDDAAIISSADAFVAPDATAAAFCPPMEPPTDGCVRRCEFDPSAIGLDRFFEGFTLHPTEERLMVAVTGADDGYHWVDLRTGTTEAVGTDTRDLHFASIAIDETATTYLRSREWQVERVSLVDGAATVVLRGGGTAPDVDFLPSGDFVAAGKLFTLPASGEGWTYATDGRVVAFTDTDTIDQSISPSGRVGTFQRFDTRTFHVVTIADGSTVAMPAPESGSDSSAQLVSDTRVVLVGSHLGAGFIDRVDLPSTRTRLLPRAFGGFGQVTARGSTVVTSSGSYLAVYSCDL